MTQRLTHMGHTDQLVSGVYGPLIVLEPGEMFAADTDLLFLVGGVVHESEHRDALRVEGTRPLRVNAGQTFDFHWTPAAAGSVTLVMQHIFATFPGSDAIRQHLVH